MNSFVVGFHNVSCVKTSDYSDVTIHALRDAIELIRILGLNDGVGGPSDLLVFRSARAESLSAPQLTSSAYGRSRPWTGMLVASGKGLGFSG